jgi:hypothetical protein
LLLPNTEYTSTGRNAPYRPYTLGTPAMFALQHNTRAKHPHHSMPVFGFAALDGMLLQTAGGCRLMQCV